MLALNEEGSSATLDKPSRPKKTKISMNLFDEDLEAMDQIPAWRRSTKTEAVRGALATEKILREAAHRGASILIEEPGQPARQIVFR